MFYQTTYNFRNTLTKVLNIHALKFVRRHHPRAEQRQGAVGPRDQHSPDHVPARLSLAAIKAETDHAAAPAYAEQAVRLNPRIPLGHYLPGRLLLRTDDVERAIAELEIAARDGQGFGGAGSAPRGGLLTVTRHPLP